MGESGTIKKGRDEGPKVKHIVLVAAEAARVAEAQAAHDAEVLKAKQFSETLARRTARMHEYGVPVSGPGEAALADHE